MTAQPVLPTCYRHPDRETRLACSNCDRPICVDCMHTARVGQRCPECAAPDEHNRVLDRDDLRREESRPAVVTWTVLGAAVAVFALQLFVPAIGLALTQLGVQANELVRQGQWWRLLTAAFFHDGITHIAFNMWALSIFGPQLERQAGSVPFAALYVASALAGGAAFYLTQPFGIAVGASGAIFGLFGAWLAASYRTRHTLAGAASLRQLLVLLGINLALPLLPGSNIAWQAHLGGLAAGFMIAFAWTVPVVRRRAALRATVAAGVGAVALVAALTLGALG